MAEKEQLTSGVEEPRYVPLPSRRDLETADRSVSASNHPAVTTSDQLELEEVMVLVQERHFPPNLSSSSLSSSAEVAGTCVLVDRKITTANSRSRSHVTSINAE